MNDAIPQDLYSVRYTSLDQVVRMVRGCGLGTKLEKCVTNSTFCLLPMNPEDFDLLGFSFEDLFKMDRAFLMGCSI